MRLFIVNLLAAGFVLIGTAANAATFTAVASATTVNIGDLVQIDLFLDATDGGAVTSTSTQVGHDASAVYQVGSGSNPPGLYCIVELPPDNPCLGGAEIIAGGETQSLSPTETLMGSYFNLNGAAVDSPNELFGSAVFQMTAAGQITFTPEFGTGQGLNGAGGVPIPTSFVGVTVNVIPEPTTALLMGVGLLGLGVAGRR